MPQEMVSQLLLLLFQFSHFKYPILFALINSILLDLNKI